MQRAGAPSHAAGGARRCEFVQWPSRIVDRYGFARGNVQSGREYGGIYSTHMRTEGQGVFESVAEAIEIGRRAGVPVDIIHLKLADTRLWGQMPELIATIQRPGERAASGSERVPLSRGPEQSRRASFRRGRMKAGPRRCSSDSKIRRCGPASSTRSAWHPRHRTGTTITRRPALGGNAAGLAFKSRLQEV